MMEQKGKEIKQKKQQQIVACLLIEGNFHIQFQFPLLLFIFPVIVDLEYFDSN